MKAKKRLAGLLAGVLTLTAMMTGAASADSVTVTTDRLNVRAKPEAKGNTIGVAEKGDKLSFVSEHGDWIQVKYEGQIGFVTEEYVKLDRDGIEEDVTENTEPYSGEGVTTDRVNIRSLPMTDASVVTVAAKKATVEITGTCGEWYKVKYGSKTGYLMAQYVTLKSGSSATAKPEATRAPEQNDSLYSEAVPGVVTVRVNMRAAASTDSAILRVLAEDDRISILGETDGWYKVYADGKEGYIVKTCAEPAGEEPETAGPAATPKPTEKPDDSNGDDETLYDQAKTGTATARVNMRKTPSTSAKIVMVVAKGAKVTVEGENGGWYKVSLSGKTGYVSGSYLAVTDEAPGATVKPEETMKPEPAPTAKPAEDTLYSEAKAGRTTARVNMRAGASTGASVVVVVDKNAGVTLTGEQGSFYRVSYGRYIGYISKSYVQIVTAEEIKPDEDEKEEELSETLYSSAKTGKTTLRVNMRREPEGDIQHVLPEGTKVSMIGERGGWYKVKYSGSTGYISKSYVKEYDEEEDKTSGEGTKGYITAASVNMRKGPGTGYGVVKVLKRGAEIRYYELKDGWYLIKSGSDTGYVSSKYVSRSEPEEDKKEESGSTPESDGKVILSDWFKGEIQSAFARNGEATVTDVRTGLKFKATRTGGYYHADAQPSTSSDTKIMYQIYGNKWQWTRRAIWVTVGGKTYAASMNGMPHGETDVISGNNFDGCFCIHFLNSKTHAGDRVDSAHQDCIQEAYKAGK